MDRVSDTSGREGLGLSKLRLSQLLGVDRKTLGIYELAPERIGAVRRAAFGFAYGSLRLAAEACSLARMVIHRGKEA